MPELSHLWPVGQAGSFRHTYYVGSFPASPDVLAGLVFSGPALDASLLQGACVGLSQSGEAVCLLGPL